MSFIKDLINLSADDLKTRFAVGKEATGIYNSKEVMNFLIADDKDLIFPKDLSKQEIDKYLKNRKKFNSFIAFIIYNQTFAKKKNNNQILLKNPKSKESLDFLTRVFIYPDKFEDDTAFNFVFFPQKFEYTKNLAQSFTRQQASAMCAVEQLRLYQNDFSR